MYIKSATLERLEKASIESKYKMGDLEPIFFVPDCPSFCIVQVALMCPKYFLSSAMVGAVGLDDPFLMLICQQFRVSMQGTMSVVVYLSLKRNRIFYEGTHEWNVFILE